MIRARRFLGDRLAAVAAGVAAIVVFGEGVAGAADVAAQLDYAAAPGCPDAGAFGAVVAERLGYLPFATEANQRVVIRIEASGRTLEGRIEWRNENGRWAGDRTFPSRTGDCSELVRVMGFAVALQFQLLAVAAAPPEPKSPADPAAKLQAPAAPTPPALAVAPVHAGQDALAVTGGSEASLAVGAGASAGLGLSPGVVALGRVFGTVTWTRVALEVAAEISLPATTHRADGAGFSEQVLLAAVAGCGIRAPWNACLLGKVGEIRASGEGLDLPATASGVFVQGGVRLAVTERLGPRAQISLHADGLVTVTRGMVVVDSRPEWTTPRVGATAGMDLGVRFR